MRPVVKLQDRADRELTMPVGRPLVPVQSTFFPGSLYMHDLVFSGGELFVTAVGQNRILQLEATGSATPVWWPRAVEAAGSEAFTRNHIQLNSIAAGRSLEESFFTASSDRVTHRKPGHRNYSVDGKGVVFSGATREPICHGLTRPHSARLSGSDLYVDNSGYGELVQVSGGTLEVVARLPGWTRGLALVDGYAFVGTSRVIPRFHRYAPGLDVTRSICGIHAVSLNDGRVHASLEWPSGNQIFGIEVVPTSFTSGFVATRGRRSGEDDVYYAFETT
jgi:uncharacterized protein (TIGR03032 family)